MNDSERPGAEEWVPHAGGLRSLRQAAHDCRGCELWEDATQVVTSNGTARARIMLVGEQPGDHEDREGEPFVGPAGRVLADATHAAGLEDHDLYTTNAVKHFRFERRGKRRIHEKPAIVHIEACQPWLTRELAIVKPSVVVCLGATAARAVLGRNVTIGAERGRLLHERELNVVITSHPSAILRLRDHAEREYAFASLVLDLRVAADAGARSESP